MNNGREDKLRKHIRRRLAEAKEDEIFCLLQRRLKMTDAEVEKAFFNYDSDVWAYGNEVYEPMAIRFVQYLHANDPGTWHWEKQEIVSEIIEGSWPCSIVDLGFGIPQKYLTSRLNKLNGSMVLLLDKYISAAEFAVAMLDILDIRDGTVAAGVLDLDGRFKLPSFDCYLLLDCVEHAINPDNTFKNIVQEAKGGAVFVLSLPVGPQVPVHYRAWASADEVLGWLCDLGLSVKRHEYLQPREGIDLFAESIGSEFGECVVEAHKLR